MKKYGFLSLFCLLLAGCAGDSIEGLKAAEPQPTGPPSYQQQIEPLLLANCNTAGCHNGSNRNLVDLRTYAQVRSRAGKIRDLTTSGEMPPEGPLSPGEVELIHEWVNLGAPNN